MTQIMVEVEDTTVTRLQKLCKSKPAATFARFSGALLDAIVQPDSTIIGITPSVWRIYQAEAEKRGIAGGATELIEALLADWPAILAPVAPKGAVVEAPDFPFGGTF